MKIIECYFFVTVWLLLLIDKEVVYLNLNHLGSREDKKTHNSLI